jgi:hypothetical protein
MPFIASGHRNVVAARVILSWKQTGGASNWTVLSAFTNFYAPNSTRGEAFATMMMEMVSARPANEIAIIATNKQNNLFRLFRGLVHSFTRLMRTAM